MVLRTTNFVEGDTGNVLEQGEDLTITVDDTPEYIIGRLFKHTEHGLQMIQIEQSGSRQNPSKNSITFEMKERQDGETISMRIGKYVVYNSVYYMSGENVGGHTWSDEFEIV